MDRKNTKDIPIRHYMSDARTNLGGYFNVISYVKFNQSFKDAIVAAISDLEQLIPFICKNHMTYAKNCGESYLPYAIEGEKLNIKLSNRQGVSEQEQVALTKIAQKILAHMNISEGNLQLSGKFTEPRIIESMLNNRVTTISIRDFISL